MKSIVLAVVVLCASLNVAFADTVTKGHQPEEGSIRIIREWK